MNPIKARGYTLIEILVAFAIMGLLLAPVNGVFNMIIKTNDISKNKTEVANVINYAFESYLNFKSSGQQPGNLPTNYLGYDIEYDFNTKSQYDLAGIRYDDYDAIIEINNEIANINYNNNSYNVNLTSSIIKLIITKDDLGLKYEILSDKAIQLFSLNVSNPKYVILIYINAPYEIVIDGIYEGNDIYYKNLTVKYITNQQNFNLISIYPTVYFEKNPYIASNVNQEIKLLTITIKKNGKIIDSKTFDITNRIQGE
ncbi:type II secretion system protein [Caloramator mitchellensis]|uniref:type II secretion system protein n=1 Tax=Caloramator mitchellensis TaxID=908809 RepID=UPI00071709C3|nr:type II secretion system protein [Caloramator mitchellensis]